MSSGGVCTKTVTLYQLLLKARVGHYKVTVMRRVYCTITYLFADELFSSSESRGSVWEFATWYYFILPRREI